MIFEKNKFLHLLQLKMRFTATNGSLKDFKKLYGQTDHELLLYEGLLEENILWKSRNDYIQIVADFVNNRVVLDEFLDHFSALHVSNSESLKKLLISLEKTVLTNSEFDSIIIDYSPKSIGFGELIDYLWSIIDIYDPDVSFEKNLNSSTPRAFGISEEVLKLNIKESVLPKMKQY